MVRRGLVCNLEALIERPELREFKKDALDHAASHRGAYVAAALTVIRAYLEAGAPRVCGPFGSYAAWSRMVRSPLVWLGEPDPVASMDAAREEDEELSSIRELLRSLDDYGLDLLVPLHKQPNYRARLHAHGGGSRSTSILAAFEQFLLRVAADKNGNISPAATGNVDAQDQRAGRRRISPGPRARRCAHSDVPVEKRWMWMQGRAGVLQTCFSSYARELPA